MGRRQLYNKFLYGNLGAPTAVGVGPGVTAADGCTVGDTGRVPGEPPPGNGVTRPWEILGVRIIA